MHPIIRMAWAPILLFTLNSTPVMSRLMAYDGGVFSGFDKVFHTLGGVVIAYAIYVFCTTYGLSWWRGLPRYAQFAIILAGVMSVGVIWEWYEFAHDFFLQTHYQPSNADTMGDLLYDTLGAAVTSLILTARKTKSRS